MKAREALAWARAELERAEVDTPQTDSEWLLAHVLGTTRSGVALAPDVDDGQLLQLRSLVDRRARREPLAYVLGEWGFRGLTLRTDRRALVPRPETEIVVERCLALVHDVDRPRVLDVGTGSGAIALAIAAEHLGARVVALDASADALALARENADRARLADRVDVVRGDVEHGLPAGPFDLVVSNPPYVAAGEVDALEPEVRDWEPRAAVVDAGQSRRTERAARDVLRPGGALVLETHWNAARAVADRLATLGYTDVTITRDLAGVERVVEARR